MRLNTHRNYFSTPYNEQGGEGLYSKVANFFGKSDENARKQFPDETHSILKLPNGKFGVANYMGQPWAQVQQSMAGLVI